MLEFCYTSKSDKRARYEAEVIPAMLTYAKRAAHDIGQRRALMEWMEDNNVTTAKTLHEAARRGLYRASQRAECDPIQEPGHTVEHGGDCDQWAVVVMACLWILGFSKIWLVFSGDESDPYRHAAVEFFASERQWISDPKYDQAGVEFNERADKFPLRSHWRLA